jgi:uncharacterized OsmC-like protein
MLREDAVEIANNSVYGLGGGVWSADPERALAVARKLRTVQVETNGGAFNPRPLRRLQAIRQRSGARPLGPGGATRGENAPALAVMGRRSRHWRTWRPQDQTQKGRQMPAIQVTHVLNSRYRVALGGHGLTVGQPAIAGGDDQGPIPLQLLAASLVACTAHYAGSSLDRDGLSREGLVVEGDFVMAEDNPPRIAAMSVTIIPPAGLLAVASHCTVHGTLRQPPAVHIGLATSVGDDPAGGHQRPPGGAAQQLAKVV